MGNRIHAFVTFIFAIPLLTLPCAFAGELKGSSGGRSSSSFFERLGDLVDFEGLVSLIQVRKIESIDDLIPLLPETFRSNYVLLYKSRSLQEASTQNPRAILYGKDGKLIVTYNGDPSQKGYNSIEIMQFRDQSSQFELREITFDGPGLPPRVSEKNPDRCLRCHQSPSRPIWDTYSFWPGVFGSADGQVAKGSREDQAYLSFLSRVGKSPGRYRSLVLADRDEDAKSYTLIGHGKGPNGSLTFNFTTVISALNFQRITQEIQAANYFHRIRYAVLAIVNGCIEKERRGIEEYLPVALNFEMASAHESYAAIRDLSGSAQRGYFADKYQRGDAWNSTGEDPGYEFDPDYVATHAALRYLMLSQGRDIQNWFTSLETVSNTFGYSSQWIQMLSYDLTAQAVSSEPELGTLFESSSASYGDTVAWFTEIKDRHSTCELLRIKSLAAFGTGPYTDGIASPGRDQVSIDPPRPTQVLIRTCVQCHAGANSTAPPIPFDDLSKLSSILSLPKGTLAHPTWLEEIDRRLESNGPDKMPRGTDFSNEERKSFETFLASLAKS